MIVGAKPEMFLPCALESIARVCAHAVINDTSGEVQGANATVIAQSAFAREARLTVIRSTFSDFATARNACIDATPAQFSNGWGLIVDADEVHGPALARMAGLLDRFPEGVDAVDGYLRHFVGSFSWWIDLNRTRCFFRLRPAVRWENRIHERLAPISRRIALPGVWFHYGHVITPREEAEKGRLYASLGQPDPAPTEAQLQRASRSDRLAALAAQGQPIHRIASRRCIAHDRGPVDRASRAVCRGRRACRAANFLRSGFAMPRDA